MPRTPGRAAPLASGKRVKLSELADHVPPTLRRVTPQQRQEQLTERRQSFGLRLLTS
jgi:hypothetical protein